MIRMWQCFRMWRLSGLGVISAIKATRRYHRRYIGR